MTKTSTLRAPRRGMLRLDEDDGFIAVLIAAMDASGHVSAQEAARAHELIWSTRRFRHRSGEAVGRKIARVQCLFETHGAGPVIRAAARAIPRGLRQTVYAVAADIALVDGRMERLERGFLTKLGEDLGLDRIRARNLLDVLRLKNSA